MFVSIVGVCLPRRFLALSAGSRCADGRGYKSWKVDGGEDRTVSLAPTFYHSYIYVMLAMLAASLFAPAVPQCK